MTSSVPAPRDLQDVLDDAFSRYVWDAQCVVIRFRNGKDIKVSKAAEVVFLTAGVLEYVCGVLCVSERFEKLIAQTTVTGLSQKFGKKDGGIPQTQVLQNEVVEEVEAPAASGRRTRNPAAKRPRKHLYDIEPRPKHLRLDEVDQESEAFVAPPSAVELLAAGEELSTYEDESSFLAHYPLTTRVAGSA